jgi:hypothetical protein
MVWDGDELTRNKSIDSTFNEDNLKDIDVDEN